jgi:hypothetical protein
MRKRVRLASKPFNKYEPHSLTLSRTCDALALVEEHGLHAHGKVQLGDIPCGERKYGKAKRGKDKLRNEEASAAGRQNVLNKYDHTYP